MWQHNVVRGAWSDSTGMRKQKRYLPLSPISAKQECTHSPHGPNLRDLRENSQSAPGSLGKKPDLVTDLVEESTYWNPGRKRKRSWLEEELSQHRNSALSPRETASAFLAVDSEAASNCEREGKDICQPVEYWATYRHWPPNFFEMNQQCSDSSKKRSHTPSYTQGVKDGNKPIACSPAFEKVLAEHNVYMGEMEGRCLVRDTSRSLCEKLLCGKYKEPQYTLFPLSEYLWVWQRAQNRNESRIYRDITPLLVPSPELLFVSGEQDLEHVTEDLSTEWTKCKTLGGPKPKPDMAVGIAQSAFTEKELAKLKNHTAFEQPTLFTDNLYFPFLLCEAKCGDQGINRADRQNMHSSSIVINAIIQLYRALEGDKAAQLNGQVLVFSISHDNELVKIYGHFACVRGKQATFYRYPIACFILHFTAQDWKKTYDFVRDVYHSFYPTHLKRIRDALAEMDDPQTQSIASGMSMEGESVFKKPDAPASKKQTGEMALLREQLSEQAQQLARYEEQMDTLKELLDRR